MKYLLAISGGVDSVVLLDLFCRRAHLEEVATYQDDEIIVGHFDHGIREDSASDARFCRALAQAYGVRYISKREELGSDASEALARERRYQFLFNEAEKNNAKLVTAHHADDMVETIALNLCRGTGWRGLAVFDNSKILRPLISYKKNQIMEYALTKRLEWVEDETNQTGRYLRNRLRKKLSKDLGNDTFQEIFSLRDYQVDLKRQIDSEIFRVLSAGKVELDRYFFINIDQRVATEMLRAMIAKESGVNLLRSSSERILIAIKTFRPGAKIIINNLVISFTKGELFLTVKDG